MSPRSRTHLRRPLAISIAAVALLWAAPGLAQDVEDPAAEAPAESDVAASEETPAEDAPTEDASADEAPAEDVPEEPVDEPLDLSFDLPVFGHTVFSMTSTTTARFRSQNDNGNAFDDDFYSIQQRFDLVLQGDELRLEVRLDGWLPFAAYDATVTYRGMPFRRSAWFGSQAEGAIGGMYPGGGVCPPGEEERCYLGWDIRPERMVLRWEHEDWSIELGDAQLVFGRGIALSFRKVDLLAVDNALRGGHVRFDDGHFRFRLHAGMANPQNQDPITLGVFRDPDDFVAAGGVGATFGPDDMINTGAHALRVWFQDDGGALTFRSRTADVLGYFIEVPALLDGQLALYAEANAMRRTWLPPAIGTEVATEDHAYGRAIYASAQLSLPELTLLVEWKDYRDFLVAPTSLEDTPSRIYSAAPSIEFDGPQRLRAIGNQRGGSVRMDYAFLPGPYSFSLNYAMLGLAEETVVDPFDDIFVTHGWATFSRRQEYDEDPSWSLELTFGYRREMYARARERPTGRLEAGDVDREMLHGQLSSAVGSGDHSLEISADHRYETQRGAFGSELIEYHIGGVSLTYTYGIQFVAAVTWRWSNFLSPTQRAERLGLTEELAAQFPSLELQWNFDPGTFVRGMIGATPGGLICSGGVCRDVPPFEGAMLQFVGRL